MRIVLDTNVLVSSLLSPHGAPASVVRLIMSGAVTPVFDDRILLEYRSVLARPKLRISQTEAELVVGYIESDGIAITAIPIAAALPDPDDLPFIEVAMTGHVDGLVTGNTRHFTGTIIDGVVPVVTPAEFLALWHSNSVGD